MCWFITSANSTALEQNENANTKEAKLRVCHALR
jgi:hypothetical protein